MLISEKQIMHLMKIARMYHNLCCRMNWDDHKNMVADLMQQIMEQQSDELKNIE